MHGENPIWDSETTHLRWMLRHNFTLERSHKEITLLDLSAVRFESVKGSFKMQCIGIHSKLCVSVYVSIKIKPLAASKQLWLSVQMAEGAFRL